MPIKRTSAFPVFFLLFYLVWAVRATLVYSVVDLSIPEDGTRFLLSNAVKILLWVAPAVAYIAWVDHRNPVEVMRLKSRAQAVDFIWAGVVTLLYFVIVFSFEARVDHRTLLPLFHSPASDVFKTFVAVFLSPFTEEFTFRGFVLPKLQEQLSFWQANILQAVLFMTMHLPFWIWQNGWGAGVLLMGVSILIIGLLLGWITHRTNSLWPAVGVHVLNNFLVAFLG